MKMSMQKLTAQEEEAMQIVWKKGKGFIKDFWELYPDPKPPYTTLASIVKKLEAKGYVKSVKYRTIYEFRPLISESEYARKFMSTFVRDYFRNSYKELVASFVKQKKLSPEELRNMLDVIESQEEKSCPGS
jgi:predicted transcriptional regulator